MLKSGCGHAHGLRPGGRPDAEHQRQDQNDGADNSDYVGQLDHKSVNVRFHYPLPTLPIDKKATYAVSFAADTVHVIGEAPTKM